MLLPFCDLNCDRNCSGLGCLQALYKSLDVALSNFFAAAEASPIVVRMVDVDVPAPKKKEGGCGGKGGNGTFRKAQAQATKAIQRITGAVQRMPDAAQAGNA